MIPRIFDDSEEYIQRKAKPFVPTKVTLAEVHAAVPKHLYQKSTLKGIYYVARDIAFAILACKLAIGIDPVCKNLLARHQGNTFLIITPVLRWGLWMVYWYWQSIIFAGCWCLAHDAGHGTLSDYQWINHLIGYTLHTTLLVPYFAWRSTHRKHHKATASLERDENYIPRTRSDFGLPPAKLARKIDYHEIFDETPMYTLLRMVIMQIFGLHTYLSTNKLGSPRYPKGANHYQPASGLFKPNERNGLILCNIGLIAMLALFSQLVNRTGFNTLLKLYLVPWMGTNHWIVMLTFLHHSDPTIPYYRGNEWSFLRGAISTTDRPLLGWAGRFFLHNISHDHVSHHLFSSVPFYNLPQVTEHMKAVLKDDYNYDSTNTFRALYRTFTQCCFVEDDGGIVFYKNREGHAARVLEKEAETEYIN